MYLIYRVLSYLLFGALLPVLLLHPKLRGGLGRRLGLYPQPRPWPPGSGPRVWLHGASAGDVRALSPIIAELRALLPEASLVVSTMTSSGHEMAMGRLGDRVAAVTRLPWDLPGATRRAMTAIAPDVLVLEYAELWPGLIHAAKRRGVRVVLTNGRLSEAKLDRYRLLHALCGNPLRQLDALLMRDEAEAERARRLGAPAARVQVTGNTKFDDVARPPTEAVTAALRAAFGGQGEPVFVAGSTHEGEELALLRCLRALREVAPTTRMIIAPRYVRRTAKLLALAKVEGLVAVERSRTAIEARAVWSADVMVLDTVGELSAAYALATLVFVGGSFVARGGQNILEPAARGRPVLFGPNMDNFRDSVAVLLGQGGIQVRDPAELEAVAKRLMGRPAELEALGRAAAEAVARTRGAARRNAEQIARLATLERVGARC